MPARGELTTPNEPETIFIGFRSSGAASIYFGEQPVLHFAPDGKLRRLFVANQQILAEQGRLAIRKRDTSGRRMAATLQTMEPAEQAACLEPLAARLFPLLTAIRAGDVAWGRTTVPVADLTAAIEKLRQRIGTDLRVGSL